MPRYSFTEDDDDDDLSNPPLPDDTQTLSPPETNDSDDDDEEEEEEEEDDEQTVSYPDTDAAGTSLSIKAVPSLQGASPLENKRPLHQQVICWTLSSAKPGNGVEQIVPVSNKETYWQSDGQQPHSIRIYFQKCVSISHVCLYLDYQLDESYTPRQISIQYGLTAHDLHPAICDYATVEFREPVGWCIVPLNAAKDALDELLEGESHHQTEDKQQQEEQNRRPVRAHLLEISILNMHQNGRDTHVRGVQLYGPKLRQEAVQPGVGVVEQVSEEMTTTQQQEQDEEPIPQRMPPMTPTPLPHFSTVGMTQFSSIR